MPEITIEPDYYNYNNFKLSNSMGVVWNLMSNRKTYFAVGLQYSTLRYETELRTYYYFERDFSNPNLNVDSNVSQFKWAGTSNEIQLPLIVNIKLAGKKIRYFISPGLTLNYFLNSHSTRTYLYIDGHEEKSYYSVTKIYWKNDFDFFPQISLGAEKELSDDLYLKIEPTIKFREFRDVFDSYSYERFMLGINFTCSIKL